MRDEFRDSQNWHRRFLPHYDASGKIQFITYRLADSLPAKVLEKIKKYCESEDINQTSSKQKYKAMVEKFLDTGYGNCLLKSEQNAKIVINNWKYFHGKSYDLLAYVVMPNHVHVLIKSYKNFPLKKIIHSWKSYTAHEISKLEEMNDKNIWQREYWDRFIRNEKHYFKAVNYIHSNPRFAGLVQYDEEWPFSSIIGI